MTKSTFTHNLVLLICLVVISPTTTMGQKFESLSSRRQQHEVNKKVTVFENTKRKQPMSFNKVPVKPKQASPVIIYRRNNLDPALIQLAAEARARQAAGQRTSSQTFGSSVFGPSAGSGFGRHTKSNTKPAKLPQEQQLPTKAKPRVSPKVIKSPFAKFNDEITPAKSNPISGASGVTPLVVETKSKTKVLAESKEPTSTTNDTPANKQATKLRIQNPFIVTPSSTDDSSDAETQPVESIEDVNRNTLNTETPVQGLILEAPTVSDVDLPTLELSEDKQFVIDDPFQN